MVLVGLLSRSAVFAEGDHAFLLFVPKFVIHAFQALAKGQGGHVAIEDGILFGAGRQVVVGYPGTQVVDVVKADVARQPLKQLGQAVIGTTLNGGKQVVPLVFPGFVVFLVLMLDVEEPEGDDAKTENDGNVYQQEFLPSQHPGQRQVEGGHDQVVQEVAPADFLPAFEAHERVAQGKAQVDGGHQQELEDRASVAAIEQFAPQGFGGVFPGSEVVNIAQSPVFELSVVGVVGGMRPAPIGVGNGAEQARQVADQIIHFPGLEKGLVAAIVLDDEDTDQEKGIDDSEAEGDPIRPIQAEVHQDPQPDKGQESIE